MTIRLRRRDFMAALGGAAAAWPVASWGQRPGKVWRIGFLAGGARPVALESSQWRGFPQGMRELGYVEGRDFIIEWRFAEGRPERLAGLAADLLRAKVDIVVAGNPQAIRPVRRRAAACPSSWLFRPTRWARASSRVYRALGVTSPDGQRRPMTPLQSNWNYWRWPYPTYPA